MTQIDNTAHKRVYNPEGSILRRDQKELLEMLLFVDEVCKKNGIPWWLSSGTLLGAARHKGFIPWDDDIDIVLLRKDYKKLEKILLDLDSDEYVFQCMKSDVEYVNTYGKFRKRSGSIQARTPRHKRYKWKGIGFDIFAIEKTNIAAAWLANFFYSKTQRFTRHTRVGWLRRLLIRSIEIFNFILLHPLVRLIGMINPRGEYHYVLGSGWPSHTFYMKYTFPLSEAEFEGVRLPVPKDMDTYLTLVYGDWRTMPSEEEIQKAIHCQEYRDEILARDNKCE